MARFDIADESGTREIVAFSRAYEAMADVLVDELPVVLVVEASLEEGEFRLVADRLIPWEDRSSLPQIALFEFDPEDVTRDTLADFRSRLDEHTGVLPVRFRLKVDGQIITYEPEGVRFDPSAATEITETCPWVRTSVTLDRDLLLRERQQNPWAPAAEPAAQSVDVPF